MDFKVGHYEIGPRDGGSSWHIGQIDPRKCTQFEDNCSYWFKDSIYKEEIRNLCSKCKTPKQAATKSGYTCPEHYKMFYGKEMPTLGEINA